MSNEGHEIEVGCIAAVKVGRNEIPATIREILPDGYRVQSTATNKEFKVRKVGRVITPRIGCLSYATEHQARIDLAKADEAKAKARRKSLIDAAHEILTIFGKPLNCKELVTKSIELGLWEPTACKTPEQTLYGSIFREIKEKENPRFRKSTTRKGAFEVVK